MLDSVPAIAAFATQLSTQKTAQQVEVAVLSKVQNMEKQQGQEMIQLIESSVAAAQSIDVHV